MIKLGKFGGSSLADGQGFRSVKKILESDENRKILVVSAPGKRSADDNKLTDLLYLTYAHIKYGVNYESVFSLIENRYRSIKEDLDIDLDLEREFEIIRENLEKNPREDYIVSRGEYLNGKLMAAYLGYDFLDAKDLILMDYSAEVKREETYEAIVAAYEKSSGKVVIPGFYGSNPSGELSLMKRGGSDITGALVSAALEVEIYENWTDVSGILMADPRIVENPKSIPRITYGELQELTYMGAQVLHEESVAPIREKKIPLNIRNTKRPEDKGTLILEDFPDQDQRDEEFITGLAGRQGYSVLVIKRRDRLSKSQLLKEVLEVFENYKLRIEHMPIGIGSLSIIVETEALEGNLHKILKNLETIDGIESVSVNKGISLIGVVGRKMATRPGISGKLFGALGEKEISVRVISQGFEEINILVGVDNKDFNDAIRVLYNGFTVREDKI